MFTLTDNTPLYVFWAPGHWARNLYCSTTTTDNTSGLLGYYHPPRNFLSDPTPAHLEVRWSLELKIAHCQATSIEAPLWLVRGWEELPLNVAVDALAELPTLPEELAALLRRAKLLETACSSLTTPRRVA